MKPSQLKCLYKFKYVHALRNRDSFSYQIKPRNNFLDYFNYYVEQRTDCLRFEFNSVSSRFFLGLNSFDVVAYDSFLRTDLITCNIYIVESCYQSFYVLIAFDFVTVSRHIEEYKKLTNSTFFVIVVVVILFFK